MDTRTVTLAEFLLARIGEDEAALGVNDGQPLGVHFITVASGERWLAEREAKRRVVEELHAAEREANTHDADNPTPLYWQAWGEYQGLLAAVEALALPFADHPDYQEAWRP